MSWPMQNTGPWNPSMMMAPDMNMGSYTPEQWAAMQQQNWQQWTQWQQQYAQWQSQYGDKYAEQMQAIQAMGGMPPLPTVDTIAPPAPPPPDKPPPPPHENNQPLYGHTPNQVAPVPAPKVMPQNMNSGKNVNVNLTTLQAGTASKSYPQASTASSVNAEALKKLAEEERLFDIQFQKWEEEIEKWKKDNVNHPDKQAYREYEEKFEACRAQLLERRQQMNKKKARLLENVPPPPPPQSVTTPVPVNINTPPPQHVQNAGGGTFTNKQNHGNNPTNNMSNIKNLFGNNSSSYNVQMNPRQNQQQYNAPHNQNQKQYNTPQNQIQQQQYNAPQNQSQEQQYNAPQNQNQHQYNVLQSENQHQLNVFQNKNSYNRSNIINIETDEKHQYCNDEYTKDSFVAPPTSGFLLASESSKKGIPGLDLVPEGTNPKMDVIDITGDKPVMAPDYTTISKGINNILGDEKIMNILSMVRGNMAPDPVNKPPVQISQSENYAINNQGNASYDQRNNNQNCGTHQYDNRQSNLPINSPAGNFPMHQNNQNPRHNTPLQRSVEEQQHSILQNQYGNYDGSTQYGGNNMSKAFDRAVPPPRPNITGPRPPIRPLLQDMPAQNDYTRGVQNPGPQNTNDIFRGTPGQDQQNLTADYSRKPFVLDHQNDYSRPPPASNQQILPDYSRVPAEIKPLLDNKIDPIANQPVRPKWIDEPMFAPSLIVEYEHKPLRLKARDFIEPVHMFEYNHKSKDGDVKKKDYEKEVEELYTRKPRRSEKEQDYGGNRYNRDYYCRDFERRAPRDDLRDDIRIRVPLRDDHEDRRKFDDYDDRRRFDDDKRRLDDEKRRVDDDRRRSDSRFDDRRRDDRDRYARRDDVFTRDRERDRDRNRDSRRDDFRIRSRSREKDSRKRELSRDDEVSETSSKRSKDLDAVIPPGHFDEPKHVVMIDDLLELPGREMRPEKIVIILRGPPGSGKSFLAKLIRDKEAEHGGTVRIMSIDDYYMQEGVIEEKDPTTGKMIKKPTLKYEYDESCEETYLSSLKRAFKRCLTDGYFTFIIYDAVNETLKSYADIWNFARQNDFQVYICTMELDPQLCFKRNIHNRTLSDIEIISARFFPTPRHHIQLDATTLLQSGAITEVQMEDADNEVVMEDAQEPEVESVFTSKWEKMDDAAQLARLDGTSKPLRSSQLSMEDYLQLDDWTPTKAKPGKKTVRWADIEERREQEKMRAIGFVVGQTDWNRMTDPTMGSSALTQTKYIERVTRRY